MASSRSRLFSKFIRNINDDLTIKVEGLEDSAKTVDNLLSDEGTLVVNGGIVEQKGTATSGELDLTTGNYFYDSLSGNISYTFTNVPDDGNFVSFILEINKGGDYTVGWPNTVTWPSATAPTLTSAGIDILGFYSHDSGSTWRGLVLGQAMG